MPGVPPDALDQVKRALKGMFGRKKKNQAISEMATTAGAPSASAPGRSSTNAPTTNTSSTAPVLPPINASHQSSRPVSQVYDETAGSGAAAAGRSTSIDESDKLEGPQEAFSEDATELTPESKLPTESLEPTPTPRIMNPDIEPESASTGASTPLATTQRLLSGGLKRDGADDVPTDETSATEAPIISTFAQRSSVEGEKQVAASDDKIPVLAEPPPITKPKLMPGMSATSGPLEDWTERL
ncbi:hypothetical protein LTR66_000615 [Elasticomyces elasticus]|nr:hypothetical protein LTR66_000615 [Elasticomyces elasticus]